MAIKLLQPWNGFAVGTILNNGDRATEAALVANFTATFDLTNGTPYVPNAPFSNGASSGSIVATSAGTLLTNTTSLAGSYKAPLVGGMAGQLPVQFWHKRRKWLNRFRDQASTLIAQTGGVTKVDDTTDPFAARAPGAAYPTNHGTSPVLVIPSGGAVTAVDNTTAGAAQNLTGQNIYVWFKVLPGGAVGPGAITLVVRLFDTTGTPNPNGANYLSASSTNWNPTNEWQCIGFAIEDFVTPAGTPPVITSITHAAVRFGGISTATQIELGGIMFHPKTANRGAVIIGFDDCRADTFTDAADELINRGIPAVLYPGALNAVVRSSVDQFQMSVTELERLVRTHGWQFAYQAFSTENPAGFTADMAVQELSQLRALVDAFGFPGSITESWFSNVGPNNPEFRAAMKQAAPSTRGYNIPSGGSITARSAIPETLPIADPIYVRAFGVDLNSHTLANLTQFVDFTIQNKGLAIFVFHGVSASNGTQFAKYTGLLDYLVANDATVDTVTFDNLVERQRAFGL